MLRKRLSTYIQKCYNIGMSHWNAVNEVGLDNYGIVTTDDVRDVCNVSIELPRWVKMGRLENVGKIRLPMTNQQLVNRDIDEVANRLYGML